MPGKAFEKRWAELHDQLREGYQDLGRSGLADCKQIALEIGELLMAAEKMPLYLRIVMGRLTPTNGSSLITPRPYQGRVQWMLHVVAGAGELLYDPMLPTPTPVTAYPQTAFFEPVTLHPIALF